MLRTDFSDQSAWDAVCSELRRHRPSPFEIDMEFVSDLAFDGVTAERTPEIFPPPADDRLRTDFVFLVDAYTFARPDRPLLVVDLNDEPGRSFRSIPAQLFSIESNLVTANMGFEEFADNVDSDGIFRGFRR